MTSAEKRPSQQLMAKLREVHRSPTMTSVHGFGFCLLGTLKDQQIPPHLVFKMYWFTALWIPLLPITVYLVDCSRAPAYGFHRRLSLIDFHIIYWGKLKRFYASVFGEALLWLVVGVAVFVIVAVLFEIFR